MDDARTTRNNVIFAAVVVVLVGVAAMYFFTGGINESPVTRSEYEPVLASIQQIQELKIAGGVLDDAGFQALQDFSVPVNPTTPPGRANPFLEF